MKKNVSIREIFPRFTYDTFGMTHGGPNGVYAGAKRAVTLFVWRRHVDERDVGFQVAFLEETRDFVQENGNTIGSACIHCRPYVTADEQADRSEVF